MKKARRFWLICPFILCVICLLLAQCATLRERREQAVLPYVTAACAEFGVPVAMVLAVIRTESDFKENAVSTAGAMGLMQLMPDTFDWLRTEKLCEEYTEDSITSPGVNIRYGTYYLAYLHRRFGDWSTALAAYNAGEGNVEEWLDDPAVSQHGKLVAIPFPETKAYIHSVLEAYEAYQKKYS